MLKKLFKGFSKLKTSTNDLDKIVSVTLTNHFRLTSYKLYILLWLKGLWTGILISLVIHLFIHH